LGFEESCAGSGFRVLGAWTTSQLQIGARGEGDECFEMGGVRRERERGIHDDRGGCGSMREGEEGGLSRRVIHGYDKKVCHGYSVFVE
jgi:hypothetical protein